MRPIDTQITSITNGPRQSNIEILRILAMFLVLVVHTTFYSTGVTTYDDFCINPVGSFTKITFRSLSIVCVNVFILISGWFGIKPSIKGLINFTFQCAYFLIGIYIFFLITGLTSFTFKGLAACFCLTQDYWFITAYVTLYILSPILNIFISNVSKNKFEIILLSYFIFQSIWGWIGNVKFIESGYSCFSFIGLYLLARYIKLYGCTKLTNWGGRIYLVTVILNSLSYYLCQKFNIKIGIYSYVNPLVILGSVGLLMYFDKIKIRPNKIINWIAKSAFAVYLFHCNPNIMQPIFKRDALTIYDLTSGIVCILEISFYLIVVFMVSILLDQPRRQLWKGISKRCSFKKF